MPELAANGGASVAFAAWRSQLEAHQQSDSGTISSWPLVKEALSENQALLLLKQSCFICIHHQAGWQTGSVSRVLIGPDSRVPIGPDCRVHIGLDSQYVEEEGIQDF